MTYTVEPEFTDEARRESVRGTCVLSTLVDAKGEPQDVHVIRSISTSVAPELRSIAIGLDENAIKAVKQYRFEPAKYNGNPVSVEVNVEIHFVPATLIR